MKKQILIAVTAGLLALGSVALAQELLQKHVELKAAKQSIAEAIEHLKEAKASGKMEFGGHRDKAEQLLKDADKEITEAAEFANQHMKK